jgi:uncharacterized membrane protein
MPVAVIVTILCAVGLYASVFMLRKTIRAGRGALAEASVVETPRARLFGGIPNAAFGIPYYLLAGIGVWIQEPRALAFAVAFASVLAAATSVFLAYSLLYVTRMPCKYCWTSHAINWILAVLLIFRCMNPSA